MIVLFDTCVILDYLMDRKPFSSDAIELVNYVANNRIEGFITVKSMMDIHYVVKKTLNNEAKTREILKKLSIIFEVIDSSTDCCLKAINSKLNDFEDAMMSLTGESFGVDYLVTRNIKDFKKSNLNTILPKDCIKVLKNS